ALFLWKSFMKRSSHVSNIEFSHIAKPQLTELRLERPENLIEGKESTIIASPL
ncbi:hypothetical protein SOVF_203190, partial [Spinacia oleracea]